MTENLCSLHQVHDMQPIPLSMANDAISMATKCGLVQLNSNLIFNDVFYVPGLSYNLISIVQLINELLCTVTFSHKLLI